MAEATKKLITRAGLERYEKELEELVSVKRKEIAEKIKIAREQGDLSENAEYDAARDEQRDNEARIAQLTELLKNVEVVSDDEVSDDEVSVGSTVTFIDRKTDQIMEYKIVGSAEVNVLQFKISNECPVGAALMKHKVGDIVTVIAPAGSTDYEITNISRAE